MRRQVEQLRQLVESADEQLYLRPDDGIAKLIALSTPGVSSSDSHFNAAAKAQKHLRILSKRKSLLAKAFMLMRHRGRAGQTVRALRRKVNAS